MWQPKEKESYGEDANKSFIASRPGKYWVFQMAIFCNVVAMLSQWGALVTPYWIISWPRVHSPFKRMGLWEVCFAGMVQPADPEQVSYHGCWWILSPMYSSIRQWIMPGWFIYCQIFMMVVFFTGLINILLHGWLWCRIRGAEVLKDAKYLFKFQTGTILTLGNAFLVFTVTLVFGMGWHFDRKWLPKPYFNYLYGSYGLVVISTFFSACASIASLTHVMIVRQEMREPPRSVPMSGSYMPASSRDLTSGML